MLSLPNRFFNDMFNDGPTPGFWHLMRVFYDGDGYVVLPLPFRIVDEIVSLELRDRSIPFAADIKSSS